MLPVLVALAVFADLGRPVYLVEVDGLDPDEAKDIERSLTTAALSQKLELTIVDCRPDCPDGDEAARLHLLLGLRRVRAVLSLGGREAFTEFQRRGAPDWTQILEMLGVRDRAFDRAARDGAVESSHGFFAHPLPYLGASAVWLAVGVGLAVVSESQVNVGSAGQTALDEARAGRRFATGANVMFVGSAMLAATALAVELAFAR
ncbi:MAG: hypothetical protein HYV07_14500 [Deltaproteobacteria bacterium]|nr:hypothetical protein [Deltaproteobacteria bacterium]